MGFNLRGFEERRQHIKEAFLANSRTSLAGWNALLLADFNEVLAGNLQCKNGSVQQAGPKRDRPARGVKMNRTLGR